jgi:ribonuclease-3
MKALAGVSRSLGLGSYLRLGKGEETTGGRDKSSILADTLEAVIGAVYLSHGLRGATEVIHRLFDELLADSATRGAGLDWKTSLQELTAAELLGVPDYQVSESGPDHEKSFRATVVLRGRSWGDGEGRSKKEAEQRAAEVAWKAIRDESAAARKASADLPVEDESGAEAGTATTGTGTAAG